MNLEFKFENQWPSVFHPEKYNWTDFTFVNLKMDKYPEQGALDLNFGLIGFNSKVRFFYEPKEEANPEEKVEVKEEATKAP